MDYIFGTTLYSGREVENLKTVGDAHTNLTGYTETRREFGNGTVITDRFRVVEHYRTDEDSAGRCYDWYAIDQHYRYIDRGDPTSAVDSVWDEMAKAYEEGVQQA